MAVDSEYTAKSSTYFKEVVERGLEIILNIDSDYNLIYINKAAQDFFISHGFIDESLRILLKRHFPASKLQEATLLRCIAGETDLEREGLPALHISYMLLGHSENEQDLTDSFTIVIKDNTIRKSIELDFEKKSEELNRFVYRISHDLRGPIASMMGLSNLVVREIIESKSLGYFQLYNTQIDRLNNIVTALGKHSVLSTSDQDPQTFDCIDIVSDILKSFAEVIESSRISIKQNIADVLFVGSHFAVQTILQSLIENSIIFRSESRQPLIKIEITEQSNLLKIIVEDNGIGIEKMYQKLIFQMFYRANDNSKGSGLGLYLFDTAVKRMKGKYELESEIDKGAKFIVTLPYDQSLLKRK